MPTKKKSLTRDEAIAKLDFKTFKSLGEDLIDAYNKGYLHMLLAGPRISGQIDDSVEQMLKKKYEFDQETFDSLVMGFFFCIHYFLEEEVGIVLENLKKSGDKKLVKKMEEKINFAKEIVAKNPKIKHSFLTSTHSLSNILEKFDWEMSLNFAQRQVGKKSFSPFAIAKIRITLGTCAFTPEDLERKPIEFDVSLQDVENMIRSLNELKKTLIQLQTKKLV